MTDLTPPSTKCNDVSQSLIRAGNAAIVLGGDAELHE